MNKTNLTSLTLAPGDPLKFLNRAGATLKPIMRPLFFERQITVWAGNSNAGKTSEAVRTAFNLAFQFDDRYYEQSEAASTLIVIPESGGVIGMACRSLMLEHSISEQDFQTKFSIISTEDSENTERQSLLNPLNNAFVATITNHARAEAERLSAPIKLVILDGFLFLGADDVSDDKNMVTIMKNVRRVAEKLDASVLLLVNTLKGGKGDYRGAESLRSLTDNMFWVNSTKAGRFVEWRDDPAKYKRRIPKTFGYEFQMNEMVNPTEKRDVWEFSSMVGPKIDKPKTKSIPARQKRAQKQEQVLVEKAIDMIAENSNMLDLDLRHDLLQTMTKSTGTDESKKRKVREALKIVKASDSISFNQKDKRYSYNTDYSDAPDSPYSP